MTDGHESDGGAPAPGAGADPDLPLVRRAKAGDRQAYERLVAGHQRRVFNVAYRFLGDYDEALDMSQDAFVQAWRSLGGFREEARFGQWLLAIVMNLCRNRLKAWKRRARARTDSLSEPLGEDGGLRRELPDPGPTSLERLEARQVEELVREEMRHVEAEFREVLVLRELQGISYEEIAAVLGLPVGTVKSRLHRGRADLAARLRARVATAGRAP